MIKLAACAALAVLAGCKKKEAAAPPPPPPATIDAAPAPGEPDAEVAAPSEDALRAGKRTGLGGPDEQPEVATEDFARALLEGKTPWSRVVAPATGVYELRFVESGNDAVPLDRFLGRHCGADADAALGKLGAAMTARLAQTDIGYELACDNSGLATGAVKSALCSIDSPAEYALGYDLVFVPDPTLGLRLVGFTIIDGGSVVDADMDTFDLETAKTGKLCP